MRCLHSLGVLAERGEPSPDERAAIIEGHLKKMRSLPLADGTPCRRMWRRRRIRGGCDLWSRE